MELNFLVETYSGGYIIILFSSVQNV